MLRFSCATCRIFVVSLLGFFALGPSVAVAEERDWQAKITAASLELTVEDELDPDIGLGLAFEYRLSRRFGVELGLLSSELKSSEVQDFGGIFRVEAEAGLRVTPVLAGLNVHLTPGRKIDLYLGPVAGYILTGDLEIRLRVRGPFIDTGATASVPVEDSFAWGGRLGVDVSLGERGLFLTASATVLAAEVGVRIDAADLDPDLEIAEGGSLDLALLALQAGVGFRF